MRLLDNPKIHENMTKDICIYFTPKTDLINFTCDLYTKLFPLNSHQEQAEKEQMGELDPPAKRKREEWKGHKKETKRIGIQKLEEHNVKPEQSRKKEE